MSLNSLKSQVFKCIHKLSGYKCRSTCQKDGKYPWSGSHRYPGFWSFREKRLSGLKSVFKTKCGKLFVSFRTWIVWSHKLSFKISSNATNLPCFLKVATCIGERVGKTQVQIPCHRIVSHRVTSFIDGTTRRRLSSVNEKPWERPSKAPWGRTTLALLAVPLRWCCVPVKRVKDKCEIHSMLI